MRSARFAGSRRATAALALSLAALLPPAVGCVLAPVVPPPALLYSDFEAPLDVDQEGGPLGAREGRASVTAILGLVSWGDASIAAAAEEGGIGIVRHADYAYRNILGIYQRYTTIVRGDAGPGDAAPTVGAPADAEPSDAKDADAGPSE